MFSMFNSVFAAIATLFGAAQKGANALNYMAEVGEEKAQAYRDEERIKIRARLLKLQADAAKDPQMVLEAPAT